MPIELVYRGSSSAAPIQGDTVLWDGEKLVTYDGEEVTLPPCEFDTSELEATVAEIDNDVTAIDRDLSAVEKRTTVLEASVAAQDALIEGIDKELDTMDVNVAQSLVEAQNAVSRVSKAEGKINELLAADQTLDNRIINLTAGQSALTVRMDDVEASARNAQSSVNTLRDTVTQVSAEMISCASKVEAFGVEVEKIDAIDTKANTLTAKVNQVDADVSQVETIVNSLGDRVAANENKIQTLTNKTNNYEARIAANEESITAIDDDLADLAAEVALFQDTTDALNEGIEELQDDIVAVNKRIDNIDVGGGGGGSSEEPFDDTPIVYTFKVDDFDGSGIERVSPQVELEENRYYRLALEASGSITDNGTTLTPISITEAFVKGEYDSLWKRVKVNINKDMFKSDSNRITLTSCDGMRCLYSTQDANGGISGSGTVTITLTPIEDIVNEVVSANGVIVYDNKYPALDDSGYRITVIDRSIVLTEDDTDYQWFNSREMELAVEALERRMTALESIGIAEEGVY